MVRKATLETRDWKESASLRQYPDSVPGQGTSRHYSLREDGLARGAGPDNENGIGYSFVSSSKGGIKRIFSREHHVLGYILQAPRCSMVTSLQPALGDAQARTERIGVEAVKSSP